MLLNLPEISNLNLQQKVKLLQAVPKPTTAQKWQLFDLLSQLDRFDDALDICGAVKRDRDHLAQRFLFARTLRKADKGSSEGQAEDILQGLLHEELPDGLRVTTLVELADIARKRHEYASATELLKQALAINPRHSGAIRKYAVINADTDSFSDLLDFTEGLIARGVRTPRLAASHITALAGLGRVDDARKERGDETLLWQGELPVPEGFNGLAEFNAQLVDELRNHPSLRFENSLRASKDSWRVDELYVRSSKLVKILLEQIGVAVSNYVQNVADVTEREPIRFFDERRPGAARISPWAVLTSAKGHEKWHVHGEGWISGVYYAAVPDALPGGEDKAGAIGFGWSDRLLGEGASERLGERIIHPQPGMLLLFPSYLHHRTWPMGIDGERICVSFDIVPTV